MGLNLFLLILALWELKETKSFMVGFLSAFAYITALNFKFVGGKRSEELLEPFRKKYSDKLSFVKVVWYCFHGGFLAAVLQIGTATFVPIQALILGITWPLFVSQYLSRKMAGSMPEDDFYKNMASPTNREEEIRKWEEEKEEFLKKIKQF